MEQRLRLIQGTAGRAEKRSAERRRVQVPGQIVWKDHRGQTQMAAIKSVMAGIDWALERPACNLVLHTAPLGGEADRAFHWHLEIIPRVTRFRSAMKSASL